MQHPGVGSREEGTRFGIPGAINFVGEELPVLAQGDGDDLRTRVDLHSHQLGAIFCGKLEPGVKGYLAMRCTLSEQGTFGLGHGFNAVDVDHIYAVLGVLEGGSTGLGISQTSGRCSMGRAVGGTAGLAMSGAAVA